MSEHSIPTLEEIAALADTGSAYGIVNIVADLAAVLIVHNRRLDALEQQARPYQEDGELAVAHGDDGYRPDDHPGVLRNRLIASREMLDRMEQRAEAAERERDEAYEKLTQNVREHYPPAFRMILAQRDAARADVERLTKALERISTSGDWMPQLAKTWADSALADALEETP